MAKLLLLIFLVASGNGAWAAEQRQAAEECRKLGFELYSPLAQPQFEVSGRVTATLNWKTIPEEWTIHRGDFEAVYLQLPEAERNNWNSFKIQVASRPPRVVEDAKGDEWVRSKVFSLASVSNEYGHPIVNLKFRADVAGNPKFWPLPVEVLVLQGDQTVCSFRIRILRPGL